MLKTGGGGKKTMSKIPTLEEMLKAGLHFGHHVSKRHPKMDPYIFTARNNISIINLELTQEKLKEALDFLRETASKGGTVLFVSTKPQALPIIEKYAKECEMPYINERWLGGTLTNFSVIRKTIKKYNDLRDQQEKGELEKYTKRERVMFSKQIEDIARRVDGMKGITKSPDVVFILDVKHEKTAMLEALKKHIPVVAVCDTNVNPRNIEYIIPANDDAISSVEMIVSLVAEAIKEGKANPIETKVQENKLEEKVEKKEDKSKEDKEDKEEESTATKTSEDKENKK